ncbi:unnamed protein product [Caenorhabditis auriculariae]|uniref:Uncharacterized protein n=1 Tax=Caenorhabditis auriculariae TaxID=2777116 RepID=A0A8S1H738_9PELO|nr:unnamed protein product [Caenorhabditis auriculariae]
MDGDLGDWSSLGDSGDMGDYEDLGDLLDLFSDYTEPKSLPTSQMLLWILKFFEIGICWILAMPFFLFVIRLSSEIYANGVSAWLCTYYILHIVVLGLQSYLVKSDYNVYSFPAPFDKTKLQAARGAEDLLALLASTVVLGVRAVFKKITLYVFLYIVFQRFSYFLDNEKLRGMFSGKSGFCTFILILLIAILLYLLPTMPCVYRSPEEIQADLKDMAAAVRFLKLPLISSNCINPFQKAKNHSYSPGCGDIVSFGGITFHIDIAFSQLLFPMLILVYLANASKSRSMNRSIVIEVLPLLAIKSIIVLRLFIHFVLTLFNNYHLKPTDEEDLQMMFLWSAAVPLSFMLASRDGRIHTRRVIAFLPRPPGVMIPVKY